MTQAAFMTVPKQLLTDKKYQSLNADAILLYSALVDRLKLSIKNGKQWQDKHGNPFIYFTRKAMCSLLKKSEPYVRKMISLLKDCGLLIEQRQGLTKPNVLFPVLLESDMRSTKNDDFTPERNSCSGNKTDISKKDKKEYTTPTKYPKKPLLGQQYSQRQYTREQLMRLVEDI